MLKERSIFVLTRKTTWQQLQVVREKLPIEGIQSAHVENKSIEFLVDLRCIKRLARL